MANAFFDPGLDLLALWESETYEILLLTPSYTFDATQELVADLVADELASSGYTRSSITTPLRDVSTSPARIRYKCDSPLDFGTPVPGGTWQWGILYRLVTNDSDSLLVAAFDIGAGGGIATDGTPLQIPVPSTGLAYTDDQT